MRPYAACLDKDLVNMFEKVLLSHVTHWRMIVPISSLQLGARLNILIVEDINALAGNIIDYLELMGHDTDYASNGKQCLNLIQANQFDAIVLDVMMPGIDGYETCRRLRNEYQCQTPVIFLTAKTELEHKLAGFEAGGDDYLTKPFEIEELMCRLLALTLRGMRKDIENVRYEELQLDKVSSSLQTNNHSIHLNNIQYKIMHSLICHAPKTVPRQALAEDIWGNEPPENDVLRTHIYQLRKLIAATIPQLSIDTEHGRGYRLSYKADDL